MIIKNDVIAKIKQAILGTQFEGKVYVVGGFVRDLVMGRSNKDIDIVVELPNGGIELANFLHNTINASTVNIFKTFGTAQIIIDDVPVELVMTRKETYDFVTRNPNCEFGDIADDVKRRDFTINSILYDISNDKIIDMMGGQRDINLGIIRTTSCPDIIFQEDPLRIMRAIRFASKLGFGIDEKTLIQIKNHVFALDRISKERIRDEFNQTLMTDNFSHGLTLLLKTGILDFICPELSTLKNLQQGIHHTKDGWNHTIDVIRNTKHTLEHRLAALFHDSGKFQTYSINDNNEIHFYQHQFVSAKIAKRFLEEYKYSNEIINKVIPAILMHMNFIDGMLDKTIRKLVNKYGKDEMLFACDLAKADSKRPERWKIVDDVEQFILTDTFTIQPKMIVAVDGFDIMDRYNLKPGKQVGKFVEIVKDLTFEKPNITKQEIFEILDDHYNHITI